MGAPPTGKSIVVEVMDEFRIENGKEDHRQNLLIWVEARFKTGSSLDEVRSQLAL